MKVRRPSVAEAKQQVKSAVAKVEAAATAELEKIEQSFLPKPKALPKTLGKDGFSTGPRGTFATPKAGEWTLDAKGRAADPVTLYVHGSLPELKKALAADGWTQADKGNALSDAKYAGAATAQEALDAGAKVDTAIDKKTKADLPTKVKSLQEVQEMPVSPQTYDGKPLLAAFERHNDPLGGRDHLRIFDTGKQDDAGREVFAIAASRDSGIRVAPDHPETGFLFHAVQPDVGGERDAVLGSLRSQGGKVIQQLSLGWTGASVYGEKVGDGKAFDVSLPEVSP